MKEITIKVAGMHCEGCSNRIKNSLESIEGVEVIDANHETGLVKVTLSKDIPMETITSQIEDIGFDIEKEN